MSDERKRPAPTVVDGEPLPPGWRPNWRAPKKRGGKGSRSGKQPSESVVEAFAEARDWLAALDPNALGPLLPPDARRELALRVLTALSVDPTANPSARVGACKVLLDLSPAPYQVPGWAPRPPELAPKPGDESGEAGKGKNEPDDGSWR